VIALYHSGGGFAAAYEYDPFGNLQNAQGSYAGANPFGFSTKFTDAETGLVYYGMRYYSPTLGRFLNRDPIEEAGGLNLYAFCGNDGVNRFDLLGMDGDTFDKLRRGDPVGGNGSSGGVQSGPKEGDTVTRWIGDPTNTYPSTYHDDGPGGAAWYNGSTGEWELWKFSQEQFTRSMLEYTAQNSGLAASSRLNDYFSYAVDPNSGDGIIRAPAQNMTPCIQCHGVSAGGFSGNVNDFAGLSAIPGSGPNAQQGYKTLAFIAEQATYLAGPGIAGGLARMGVSATVGGVREGAIIYRVFGGEAGGLGRSWTTVAPDAVADFRAAAGLFEGNTAEYVITARLQSLEGVSLRTALPGPTTPPGALQIPSSSLRRSRCLV
jgi:RHS repeat-associated protein